VNVVPLGNITRLDLSTDRVLDAVKGECSDGVVVIGYDNEGEFYFASSIANGAEVLWLLEQAKLKLLEIGR
jgi:hypothetical protein